VANSKMPKPKVFRASEIIKKETDKKEKERKLEEEAKKTKK